MTTTNAQKNEDPQSQIGTSSSSASSHQEKSLNTENEQEMEALFRRAISNSSFLNVSRKNPFKPIDESLARNRWRKTKTMATCGPSFCTEEQIAQLLYLDDRCQQPDLDCLRLNLAHNFLDFHEGVLNAVKRLRQRYEHSYKLHGLAILAELRGSQVRTQKLEETQILHQSDVVNIRVSSNDNSQSGECISEMYDKDIDEEDKDNFTIFLNMESFGELKSKTSLEKNDIIYIDYGRLVLQVNKIHEKAQYLRAVMKNSGKLGSSKFVSFRGKSTEWILTEKDFEDIEFCVNHGVDMIAVPAVQSKAHVLSVRKLIRSAAEKLGLQGKPLPRVFSKISDRNGVVNLDEIIKASDGIIIARGSIGVNVPLHTVAIVQKMIIQKCNQACIPVIVGSQVLRSMYKNPLPTRAEMSDVLNATMDGCDCVMVAITAHGKYPLEAVDRKSVV